MKTYNKRFLVMGVSGSGKSSFGKALSDMMACDFIDGDDLHPPSNIEKMRQGTPLTTKDRLPWLEIIALKYQKAASKQVSLVIACSALTKHYRDILRKGDNQLITVFLSIDEQHLNERMKNRTHFMPISLLQSQLDLLESPVGEANTFTIQNEKTIQLQLQTLVSKIDIL